MSPRLIPSGSETILKRLASDEPPLEEDERDRQQHDRHGQ